MQKILITGGTTFVSKFTSQYFADRDYDVYVINRNNREQNKHVNLINCDRLKLGNTLYSILQLTPEITLNHLLMHWTALKTIFL